MRVVVCGSRGMLGQALIRALDQAGHDVVPLARADLDVSDLRACRARVDGSVGAVVNATAWTDVDGAEAAEQEAFTVNALGARNLAIASREVSARLVHVSTDYVFDGRASAPYAEDAPLEPLGAYGRSKAAGEWAVRAEHPNPFLVRTAWLYGPGGSNFVATIARLAGERETLDVVDDQRGQPTTTIDVAQYVARLLADPDVSAGIYHATSEGETTWYGLARAVFEELGLDADRIRRTSSQTLRRPAPRPGYSVLGHGRGTAIGVTMPDWRSALTTTLPAVIEQSGARERRA